HVADFVLRNRQVASRWRTPPVALGENFPKRFGDHTVVFVARDFLVHRAGEADHMGIWNVAFLRVVTRQAQRLWINFVVNNEGRVRFILDFGIWILELLRQSERSARDPKRKI